MGESTDFIHIPEPSHNQLILRLHPDCILQQLLQQAGKNCNDTGAERDEHANRDDVRDVFAPDQRNRRPFTQHDKRDDRERAILDRLQRPDRHIRERHAPVDKGQQPEGLIQRNKKWQEEDVSRQQKRNLQVRRLGMLPGVHRRDLRQGEDADSECHPANQQQHRFQEQRQSLSVFHEITPFC